MASLGSAAFAEIRAKNNLLQRYWYLRLEVVSEVGYAALLEVERRYPKAGKSHNWESNDAAIEYMGKLLFEVRCPATWCGNDVY